MDHNIFLRRLYFDGIIGDNWLLLKDMYTDLTSRVKWEANLSNPIIIRQEVRQGGVLSTSHYKRDKNRLLIEVENRFTGALMGHIKIPHVTVADDLAFLTHLQTETQFMLDSDHTFAGRNRYGIHPTKSCVLTYSNGHEGMEKTTYTMGEDQTKHLGIFRETSKKKSI